MAILASLAGLFIVLGITLSFTLSAFRKSETERLRDTAQALAVAVDARLGVLEAGMRTLAASPMLDHSEIGDRILRHAQVIGQGFGGEIGFIPAAAADPTEAWPALPGTIELMPAQGLRSVLSDLTNDAAASSLRLSVPVTRDGQSLHVMRFTFSPAILRPLLLTLDLRGDAFAAIADGQLRIVAHSRDPDGRRTGVPAPTWVGSAIERRQRILVTGPGWQDSPNVYAVERLRAGDLTAVTGWPQEELRGKNDAQYLLAPEAPGLRPVFLRTMQDLSHYDEVQVRRPDDSWSWVRRSAVCLSRRPDGGAEILMYTINIDRERRAEAHAIASSRLASLGEMSAGLAHELLQPLTAILLAAENAQTSLAEDRPGQIAVRLERVIQQAIRASRIIEDLRRFARAPDDKPRLIPVRLDGPVAGALALTGGMLRDVQMDIALGAPPPIVLGDRAVLEHVLVNLLSNAKDAMASLPANTPRRVRICAREADGLVRLSMADNGGGVDPDILARIFEPFVTTKGPHRGLGLGLSVAMGLVERLGGTVEVRNEGEGAVVVITLQAARSSQLSENDSAQQAP